MQQLLLHILGIVVLVGSIATFTCVCWSHSAGPICFDSHIRMQAKREAVAALEPATLPTQEQESAPGGSTEGATSSSADRFLRMRTAKRIEPAGRLCL